jgi:hypothetical protein
MGAAGDVTASRQYKQQNLVKRAKNKLLQCATTENFQKIINSTTSKIKTECHRLLQQLQEQKQALH